MGGTGGSHHCGKCPFPSPSRSRPPHHSTLEVTLGPQEHAESRCAAIGAHPDCSDFARSRDGLGAFDHLFSAAQSTLLGQGQKWSMSTRRQLQGEENSQSTRKVTTMRRGNFLVGHSHMTTSTTVLRSDHVPVLDSSVPSPFSPPLASRTPKLVTCLGQMSPCL